MPAADRVSKSTHAFFFGNVDHVRGNQRGLLLQRLRCLQQPCFIHVRERQRRARRCQLLRQGAADAGARSGHHGHAATQK